MTDINDQIIRGLADAMLERTFGVEWIKLESGHSKVIDDFIQADILVSEYKRRIGEGNLRSYAATLS